MQLKQLFTDDSAVSPVIGVILMVAITVILAAVIGTFVLNLGSSIQSTAPQASIEWSYNQSAGGPGDGDVTAVHSTGDALKNSTLSISETDTTGTTISKVSGVNTFTAGEQIIKKQPYNASETIRIVWNAPEGSNSAVISSSTAPSG
ncbi:MAG: type IV pilin [Haloquadratum sp.]